MDEFKLDKALALLQSLLDELPKHDIEEKYVDLYQRILTDIQSETGHDLSYYSIPPEELKRHVTSVPNAFSFRRGSSRASNAPGPTYSNERYCDRARFLIAIKGAINFINSQARVPDRRVVGFTQPE